MSERLDDQQWLVAVLAVLMAIPALLVLAANRLGPGLSPDSVDYASAARSLAESGTFTTYNSEPLTIFPPGLPFILGTADQIGLDLQIAAVALNVVCVAACVLMSYVIAETALSSRGWALAVAAVLSVSYSTVYVFTMLWTEPLFTALTLIVLLLLVRGVKRRTISLWEVLLLGASVSVATTIRFVGFTLIPVVALAVVFALRDRGWTRAAGVAIIATGVSSIGLLYVAGRNISLGVAAFGERSPSGIPLIQVLDKTAMTLGKYAYPTIFPSPWVTTLVGISVAALVMFGLVRAWLVKSAVVIVLSGFTVIYWISLWYGQFATTLDGINPRLTAPAFTPMLVLMAFAAQGFLAGAAAPASRQISRLRWQIITVGSVGLLLASLVLNFAQSTRTAYAAAVRGIGFNSVSNLNSPLARALTGLPPGGIAATNAPLAYWTSGREPIVQIPRRDFYSPPEKTAADLDALKAHVASGKVTFLAFFSQGRPGLTPDDLKDSGIRLTLVRAYEDGDLYKAR